MKTPRKNITEEIERIKSLFTEERLYGNLVEQDNLNLEDPNVLQRVKKAITNASDEVRDKVLSIGPDSMKDRKKNRQGFGYISNQGKDDAMRTQKRDQRNTKKEIKNNLAACNRGMKALQKYFLSSPNPDNRMTYETFKKSAGSDFNNRKGKVVSCIDNFTGQMKTDKEYIDKKTVTEWIKDIIIDGNNNHRKISKEVLKGTVGKGEQIKIKNSAGKKIGVIRPTETDNQYTLKGEAKINFLVPGTEDISDIYKRYILRSLKLPNNTIKVVPESPIKEKDMDSFEFIIS